MATIFRAKFKRDNPGDPIYFPDGAGQLVVGTSGQTGLVASPPAGTLLDENVPEIDPKKGLGLSLDKPQRVDTPASLSCRLLLTQLPSWFTMRPFTMRVRGRVEDLSPMDEGSQWATTVGVLGGTDASVVALAERLNTDLIITLDRRHFNAVRPRHCLAFRLLPE